jgi:quinol monooxygenase YgiN
MHIIAGKLWVAPGDRQRYLESLREIVQAVRNEPGCLEYAFSADPIDEGLVRLYELWASRESLAEHQAALAGRQWPSEVKVESAEVNEYEAVAVVRPAG